MWGRALAGGVGRSGVGRLRERKKRRKNEKRRASFRLSRFGATTWTRPPRPREEVLARTSLLRCRSRSCSGGWRTSPCARFLSARGRRASAVPFVERRARCGRRTRRVVVGRLRGVLGRADHVRGARRDLGASEACFVGGRHRDEDGKGGSMFGDPQAVRRARVRCDASRSERALR